MPSKRKTKPRSQLSAPRIVAEALKLIDAKGVDGFSFRVLAKKLGCEAMSIYHYFPSKTHLFDALVDHCIFEIDLSGQEGTWLERLRHAAYQLRAVALRHPGFFLYFGLYRMNSRNGLGFIQKVMNLITESGLPDDLQARHFRAIGYYLIGAGLEEAMGYAKGPSAAEPVSSDEVTRDFPTVARFGKYFPKENHEQIFSEGLETLLAKLEADAKHHAGTTP
jgi:AcrR family transcriptional regulator